MITANAVGGIGFWVIYAVFLIGLMYFVAIRPQNKEKKRMAELMASIAVGDAVLTSSGFYGVVIDMTDDTVIIEFGNNKNCRIPMQKTAIVQVESARQRLIGFCVAFSFRNRVTVKSPLGGRSG